MSEQQIPPGFNTPIPPEIMTPDRVETRIGTLSFIDGVPDQETTDRLYDHLDFVRGVEAFLHCVPAASLEAVRRGMVELGCDAANKMIIADELLDSIPLLLTGNTDTVYALSILDLGGTGRR